MVNLVTNLKSIGPSKLISFGLFSFFFLSLVQPWNDLSRAFIFLCVFPGAVWAAYRNLFTFCIDRWLWLTFALLMVYLFISAVGLSDTEPKQVKRHAKWVVEVVLFALAVYFVVPIWFRNTEFYSKLILLGVLVVSFWAVFGFYFIGVETMAAYDPDIVELRYGSRLSWLGFLSHPIKGPSVVVMLFALGAVLYQERANKNFFSFLLLSASFGSVLILCAMSGSRGPLGSLLFFTIIMVCISLFFGKQRVKLSSLILGGLLCALSLIIMNEFRDLGSLIDNLISRGSSRRFDVWSAVYDATWISPWVGFGIATEFNDTAAGQALMEIFGRPMSHSHNVFLHAFVMSGIIGFGLFFIFCLVLIGKIIFQSMDSKVKSQMFSLLGLTLMLTATEGYRLVSSPRPDWVMVWLPLFFVFGYMRYVADEVVNES